MVHTCNLRIWEVEAGESGIQDQVWLHSEFETLPQKEANYEIILKYNDFHKNMGECSKILTVLQ